MNRLINSASENIYKYNMSILNIMNKLSMPLLDHFGIHLITYRRFYNDGNIFHLSNDRNWLEHCKTSHHWHSSNTLKRVQSTPKNDIRVFIWDKVPKPNDSVYEALYNFGLWNGVTICEKNDNYTEVWSFSGNKERININDIYANNIGIVKRFMLYFQDKAYDIINYTDNKRLLVPINSRFPEIEPINNNLNKFVCNTKIDRYILKEKGNNIVFTKREAECLFYLSCGKSYKDIARLLSLSPRTVEAYLNLAKGKVKLATNDILNKYYPIISKWIF